MCFGFWKKKPEQIIIVKNPCPCISCLCFECDYCFFNRCPCLNMINYAYGVKEYDNF